MNQFWNVIVQAIRLRLNRFVTVLRRLSSPTYLFQMVVIRARELFTKLLDVKPKHKKDYYTVFRWMISRRLANLVLIVAGVACIVYLVRISPFKSESEQASTVKVYDYSSIPLRFVKGQVKIKAKSGYVAYEGHVSDGYVNGEGKLYNSEGVLIYDGEFKKNLYNGEGTQYRESGAKLYKGEFSEGVKEGQGELYGTSDNKVFSGEFHLDKIVYTQLLDKTAEEISEIYTGDQYIFQNGNVTENAADAGSGEDTTDEEESDSVGSVAESGNAVVLSDISAIYYSKDSSDSIEDTVKSNILLVGESSFVYGNKTIDSLEGLEETLGEPEYQGNSYLTFLEAVGINWLQNQGKEIKIDTGIDLESVFDEVSLVNGYDADKTLYLHTYKIGELTYTFYSIERTGSFFMYEIE